jgi:hypothetical protein
MPPPWSDIVYLRYSPFVLSTDDYTIPSPTNEVPNLRPAPADNNVRWLSLFPSAPVVVERQSTESGLLLGSDTPPLEEKEECVSSPMSSPTRWVLSYATSTRPQGRGLY